MNGSFSALGLLTSLFLPWILGSIWCYWLLSKSGRHNLFVIIGQGYLLGISLTALTLGVWEFIGLPLWFWATALTLLGMCVIGFFAIRGQSTTKIVVAKTPPLEKWQIVVTTFFILLISCRYTTLVQEITLRPLFSWDAWMNWSPKAIVWFHSGEFTPFVSPGEWLQQAEDTTAYTMGARDSWKYPATVPLIQLWSMLATGTSDHTLIYLPWLLVILALGLALYGHLRLAGASMPLATLGCYALLNLPYINVQTVLAGYADTWVAATFGCAVFALHEWGEHRQWPYAVLSLLLALLCTQLKIPGLIMGGIIVAVFLSSIIKFGKTSGITLLTALVLCIVYIAVFGVDFSIPNLGRIALSTDGITVPYIGYYELSYHPVHHAIIDTTLLMINWNLLWYLFIFLGLLRVANGTVFRTPSLALRSVLLALLFIFFVYYFTNRYIFAVDYTQVNRALIYVIPPLVFYMIYARSTLLDLQHKSRSS
ncbi:MAG: hypothetical protein DRQ97_08405 [Gammaproteobacteria bacterium]|nr:MAG: hypothetical protein DRQ97_08405 [Gammaproteobacteria bacterium]